MNCIICSVQTLRDKDGYDCGTAAVTTRVYKVRQDALKIPCMDIVPDVAT